MDTAAKQNRIDFFEGSGDILTIPAGKCAVYVDGRLSRCLEVTEISRQAWPGKSGAKFLYCGQGEAENVYGEVGIGRTIAVRRIHDLSLCGGSIEEMTLFAGTVDNCRMKIGQSDERVVIEAVDFGGTMDRITVFGRRMLDSEMLDAFTSQASQGCETIMLSGERCVFNENAEANGSGIIVERDGVSSWVFCDGCERAKLWGIAEAIDYLLSEYLPVGILCRADLSRLRKMTGGQKLYDVDVTGMSLYDAVGKLCGMAGLKYRIDAGDFGRTDQSLVIYRPGCTRAVELNMQKPGDVGSLRTCDITEVDMTIGPMVTNRYIGIGDYKKYEGTFELVKAWDHSKATGEASLYSPSTNPDFYEVRNVFRKWCLNEAGDYSGEPFNRGDAYDLGRLFDGEQYVRKPRRFHKCLSCDEQGRSLGFYLEVSCDAGASFTQFGGRFDVLTDECGIWLSDDGLDSDIMTAAMAGNLRFRITATIVSDSRLTFSMADGAVGSTIVVVDHLLFNSDRFRYRKVSGLSKFFGQSVNSLGNADEADDINALAELVRYKVIGESLELVKGKVQTATARMEIRPGDTLTSTPESRDIFGVRADSQSFAYVEKVRIDFGQQKTDIEIIRKRKTL